MTKAKTKERSGNDSLFVSEEQREGGHQPKPGPKPNAPTTGSGVAVIDAHDKFVPANGTLAILQTVERLSTNKDTNPAIVEMLLKEMRELRAEQARSIFDSQMAVMQPKLPVVGRKGRIEVRKKDAKGERTGEVLQSTSYAKWEDIVEEITPILGEHGFSLTFKTGRTPEGLVHVESTLAGHGHRQTSEIDLMHDATGSKNSVQAIVSSISYAKRVLGSAMLNLVSRGEDDDGNAAGGPLVVGTPLNEEQVTQLIELCEAVECPKERLIEHMNSAAVRPKGHPDITGIATIPASRFDEAIAALRSYESNKKEREASRAKPGAGK